MFRWMSDLVRRWWFRRQRNLFRFFDGERTRAVDPYAVYVALETHPEFRWEMTDAILAGAREETEIACQATAHIFGVARYNADTGHGLTDSELADLLAKFADYCADVKKKQDLGSTSSSPMDSEPSTSAEDHPATTNSASGSGSTGTEPRHARQSESCEA